ncbi:hypothetical protein KUTeg_024104 [Tegillarca granosa]|uniref:Uncharacterized protein n=1 Tax=Tegillarca granosa TaxID=220873 RepID=A0ABQ9DWD9_TEGGR|nr:hypothetical protein KUTeg_024104 [Tegillarca granosa]
MKETGARSIVTSTWETLSTDINKQSSTTQLLWTTSPSFEEDKTDTNTHFVFSSSDIQSSTSSAESMTDSRTHLSEMPSNDIQSIVSTEDTSLFLFATPSIHIQSTVSSTEIMKETGARSIVTSTWETLSTDMNKQSSTTQLLWTTSSIYHSRACKCPCSKVQAQAKYHNMTEEKLQSIIHETMKDLDIPKKNLSSSIRKRTSAKDDRPASTGIGYLGITILAVVFGCIIMSDLANLYRVQG